MSLSVAMVVGAALIAAAIAVSHRYAISATRVACHDETSACSGAWRIDQWTGTMQFCQYANTAICLVVPAK